MQRETYSVRHWSFIKKEKSLLSKDASSSIMKVKEHISDFLHIQIAHISSREGSLKLHYYSKLFLLQLGTNHAISPSEW